MTLPSWPEELMRPQGSDYGLNSGDNRRWSDRNGTPAVRPGWSQPVGETVMTIYCAHWERARFDRFWVEETNRGVKAFLMPDPVMDGLPLLTDDGAPVLLDGGSPLLLAETWLCLFGKGAPQYTISGATWRIRFPILVLP